MTDTNEASTFKAAVGVPGGSFDVALGVRRTVLDKVLQKLHKQLYPRIFTGQGRGSAAGMTVDFSWDVKTPPLFDFTPTEGLQGELRSFLEQLPKEGADAPKNTTLTAELLDTTAAAVEVVTFKIRFPEVFVRLKGGDVDTSTTAVVTAYVQISTENGRVAFKPLRAEASNPNPDDTFLLNNLIVPEVMKLAGALASSIQLPDLQARSIKFDWPVAIVQGDYLVVMANEMSRHRPVGQDAAFPVGPDLFAVVSRFTLQSGFAAATFGVRHDYSTQGERDLGITTAHWDARVEFSDIRGNANGLTFPMEARAGGTARGWLTSIFGDIGAAFRVDAVPKVEGSVEITLRDKTLRGEIARIGTFGFTLIPTGSVAEQIVSYILSPLSAAVMAFSPLIVKALKGISFDIWTIPEIPATYQGIGVKITPVGLSARESGDRIHITGGVNLQ